MSTEMNARCQACSHYSKKLYGPIRQLYRESDIAFILDYPSSHDHESESLCSSLKDRRTVLVYRFISEAGLDPNAVSLCSIIQCVTGSKATLGTPEFQYCSADLMQNLKEHGAKYLICMGAVAGTIVTGKPIKNIDTARSVLHQVPNSSMVAIVTYALSVITNTGCSACGGNVYYYLIKKDIGMLVKHRALEHSVGRK